MVILTTSVIAIAFTSPAMADENTGEELTQTEQSALTHWRFVRLSDCRSEQPSQIVGQGSSATDYVLSGDFADYAMVSDDVDTTNVLEVSISQSGWFNRHGDKVSFDDPSAVTYRHVFKGKQSGNTVTYTLTRAG